MGIASHSESVASGSPHHRRLIRGAPAHRLGARQDRRHEATRRTLVVAGLALAGGIHLGVAAVHGDATHLPFFAGVGTVQAALAVALAGRQPRVLVASAALLSTLVAATWVATRVGGWAVAAPMVPLAAVVTGAEIITAVAAVTLLGGVPAPEGRAARPRQLAAAVAVLLAAGGALLMPAAHRHPHPSAPAAAEREAPDVFGDLFDHHPFDETVHDEGHSP